MRIQVYGKILKKRGIPTRHNRFNLFSSSGKFVGKNPNNQKLFGLSPHLEAFERGTRVKIIVETVSKKEFLEACYNEVEK